MYDFGIQIGEKIMDFFPNTALSFELRNPSYFGGDGDVIQESYMFTLRVPMTEKNAALLRQPQRVDNDEAFIENATCSVWCEGLEVFRGLLTVRSASAFEAEIFIAVNSVGELKNTELKDLPHTQINLAALDALSYLGSSCWNPEAYDFICFPVHNPDFYAVETANKYQNQSYQNLWGSSPTEVSVLRAADKSPITPFLKISYLFRVMARKIGLNLINSWQTTQEMRNLCAYNNYSIVRWSTDATTYTIDPTLNLGNHVSDTKAAEYLKKIARLFNLGVYVNFFDNTLEIVPNETLLDNLPVADWTDIAVSRPVREQDRSYPARMSYGQRPLALPDVSQLTTFAYEANGVTSPEGIYTNAVGDRYYHHPDLNQNDVIRYVENNFANIDSTKSNLYESPLNYLPAARVFMNGMGLLNAPTTRQKGSFRISTDQEAKTKFDDALIFYRGIADYKLHDGTGNGLFALAYPLALSEERIITGYRARVGWDTLAVPNNQIPPQYLPTDVQNTLLWTGEKGIYARNWARWVEMLKNRSEIEGNFALTARMIREFNFKNVIRYQNRNCLVRRIRVNLTQRGASVSECTLVTI